MILRWDTDLGITSIATIQITAEAVDVGALWSLECTVTALSTALEVWALTCGAARTQCSTRYTLTLLLDHVTGIAVPELTTPQTACLDQEHKNTSLCASPSYRLRPQMHRTYMSSMCLWVQPFW